MSPFMHAHQVNEPILLIHGIVDNNSGTFPVQSRRFFHALKGHGAIARLVMLPHESHGYVARESVMHTLWEQHQWLERHVKQAAPRMEGRPRRCPAGRERERRSSDRHRCAPAQRNRTARTLFPDRPRAVQARVAGSPYTPAP